MQPTQQQLDRVAEQLGHAPRGVLEVSYITPDGEPAVVKTAPKLDDGTPFPTLYCLTDPRLTAEASRLEVAQVMKWMEARLNAETDEGEDLRKGYRAAHEHYLAERNAVEDLGTDFSGGGMPERVKCLHVLIAYALAEGPARVRFGTEALSLAAEHGNLRGTAIPTDWPTLDEPGVTLAEAGEGLE